MKNRTDIFFSWRHIILTGALAIIFAAVGINAKPAIAATLDESTAWTKAVMGGLSSCYMERNLLSTWSYSEAFNFSTLLELSDRDMGDKSKYIALPIGLRVDRTNGQALSCRDIFIGNDKFDGAIKLNGKEPSYDVLKDPNHFGYEEKKETAAGDTRCLYYKYGWIQNTGASVNTSQTKYTNAVCFKVDTKGNNDSSDDTINVKSSVTYAKIGSDGKPTGEAIKAEDLRSGTPLGDVFLQAESDGGGIRLKLIIRNHRSYNSMGCKSDRYVAMSTTIASTTKFNDLQKARYGTSGTSLPVELWANTEADSACGEAQATKMYIAKVNGALSYDTDKSTKITGYKILTPQSAAAGKAITYLTGNSSNSVSTYRFTNDELVALYTHYYDWAVKNYPGILTLTDDCGSTKPSGDNEYALPKDKGATWCKLDSKKVSSLSSAIQKDKRYFAIAKNGPSSYGLRQASFTEMLKAYMDLDFTNTSNEEIANVGESSTLVPDNPPGGGDTGGSSVCIQAGGALGWIICPVIQGVSTALMGIYDTIIEPFLEVKSSTMSSSGDVYVGWNKIRGYANIIFAIAFIIVILAQITGFGISNYNIKKLLPRLLMVVVLVNVSFILCQLATDVSNILGAGLQTFFSDTLLKGIGDDNVNNFTNGLQGILTVVLSVVAVGAAAVAIWKVWLIPFLLALLSCAIAILFFFVLLSMRQAAIIILTILAPVAIVCYALPNTKKLFDKWLHLYGSLLMIYPIAGLLIGGGTFAATVVVSSTDNVVIQLVGMLLNVIPFFFLPSLLRSSLNAIGSLGNKISNFGNGIGKWAKSNVAGSDRFKDFERQYNRGRIERQARSLTRQKNRKLKNNPNARLSDYKERKLRRLQATTTSMRNEERDAVLGNMMNGNEQSLIAGAGNVNLNDMQGFGEFDEDGKEIEAGSAAKEFEAIANALEENPTDQKLLARSDAMIEHLMSSPAGVKIARQVMQRQLAAGHNQASKVMATTLMSNGKYINAMKKDGGRGFFGMVQDLAGGHFDRATGGHGQPTMANISAHYGMMGSASYKPEELVNEDESVLDEINAAMAAGYGTDEDRRNYAELANQILSTPTLLEHAPEKVLSRIRTMASLGYGAGAVSYSQVPQGTHTVGSAPLASTTVKTAEAIQKRINDLASSGALEQGGQNYNEDSYKEAQKLGENLTRALEGPTLLAPDVAESFQKTLSTLNSAGVKDMNDNVFKPIDNSSIKVHGAPQYIEPPKRPAEWDANGHWKGNGKPTAIKKEEYKQWLAEYVAAERHNKKYNLQSPQTPPNSHPTP